MKIEEFRFEIFERLWRVECNYNLKLRILISIDSIRFYIYEKYIRIIFKFVFVYIGYSDILIIFHFKNILSWNHNNKLFPNDFLEATWKSILRGKNNFTSSGERSSVLDLF